MSDTDQGQAAAVKPPVVKPFAEQGQMPLPGAGSAAQSEIKPDPVEPAPDTAKTRLRNFEDDVLGEDAVRISGQIEKGHGSHFKTKMTHEQRVQHGALEKLVEAEQKVADTSAALAKAEAEHEAAEKYAVACTEASARADAERKDRAAKADERKAHADAGK
jgi:hypothetical protein